MRGRSRRWCSIRSRRRDRHDRARGRYLIGWYLPVLSVIGAVAELRPTDQGPRSRYGAARRSRSRGRISGVRRPDPALLPLLHPEALLLSDGEYEVEDPQTIAAQAALRPDHHLPLPQDLLEHAHLRVVVSTTCLLRFLFSTPFRDVSTGLRLVRRAVRHDLELESTSPFVGAELAIKAMLKGYRVGEVGIQTFPRSFGSAAPPRPEHPGDDPRRGGSTTACSRTSTSCRAVARALSSKRNLAAG